MMAMEKEPQLARANSVSSQSTVHKRKSFTSRKAKRRDDSILGIFCAFIVEHQIGIAVNLLLLLSLVHILFPAVRPRTKSFFELSYYNAENGKYGRGWEDMYFVLLWIVLLTGARAATMDYVLKPLAKSGGINSRKLSTRFAEQGWLCLYCSVSWSIGFYIFYTSSFWLDLRALWYNWPTQHLEPTIKYFYLIQFSFWLQQMFVINIEEKRKDHWQMITHHIFTCALVFTSYGFYQTNVGTLIMCIMDFVDILLPAAKMLNYLRFRTTCDAAFGLFMVAWFITRHIFYPMVLWSLYRDIGTILPLGCYNPTTGALVSSDSGTSIFANVLQPFNDPKGLVCFNPRIKWWFLNLLLALQVLLVIWFGMIIRVAYGVLSGKAATDSRSDEEDEEEVDDDEITSDLEQKIPYPREATLETSAAQPIEHEVDASEVTGAFKIARNGSPAGKTRAQRKSAAARASGISIPGHGDHKELLGRIGCDKPS